MVHDKGAALFVVQVVQSASGSALSLALNLATPPDSSSPGHHFAAALAPSCLWLDARLSRAVDVQMPSRVDRERLNMLAHILRVTARRARTPAKLFAALVGVVLALSVRSISTANDAIDS